MDYREALENVGTYNLEAMMARMDRIIKRLWIVILLLIVLLVASNCAWLYYESQYETDTVTTQTVEQSTNTNDGDATINDGVHINGNSNTEGSD